MDIASLLAMTLGSAWASGINLYATVFVLGMANNSGTFTHIVTHISINHYKSVGYAMILHES